ncbi:SDR family oxidoreductase [Brevibacillus sp. WF146]|jgi:NAD(P)-dependent dehydrogenase (short-subunit alcohol dehydrogenase family)|uniref:SDR family oxidoreductase n=1 Tax=Brevibacillus sp. WF146 TaxID=319501 RepID=UPI0007EDDE2C|nr:SDR family oxidoreductase [Brevibacillus sp. WF146]UYZ14123.1 SDR family oxidoreductase [Brevibacillus sp. WF146]
MTVERETRAVALVTGASSGFGLHTSVALAQAGFRVVAAMRSPEKRHDLLQTAETAGVRERIDVRRMDVTDHAGIVQTVEEIAAAYGRIDVLVNNAGFAAGGVVEEVDGDTWRAQMETNFFGTVAVTRAVLPHMRRQRRGKIINMSSVSGRTAFPGYAPYAASKFAVEGFTEALRLEVLPFGIHAVLIEPGAYKTEIWRKGFATIRMRENSPYQPMLEAVLRMSRRTAETAPPPQEVAAAVVKAALAPAPRLRYPLGRGTAAMSLLRSLLPWKWYERIVLWALHR